MKNRWLMGAAAAALTVAGALSSQAADLPTRKEAPAPIFVPPPFTWTGFYIGGNAGGIWGTGGNPSTTVVAPGVPLVATFWPQGNINNNQSGFIGGGQAGYNWQTGAFVLGVETDFDGSTLSRSRSIVGPTFADFINPSTNDFFTANGKISLDWLGSTRGRVGFVATPDNRLMFYGTGGVAYAGVSGYLNVFDANHGFFFASGNQSDTRTGWTVGGGVEYAWTNNIIVGAEYLYFNLGSRTLTTVPNAAANAFFGTQIFSSTKINFDGNVVRGRISYKF
jgi:outer membrane immunogenic protein